jgi:acyl-CoA reductase-like NAD-dependent aldehyde dehydrogenase
MNTTEAVQPAESSPHHALHSNPHVACHWIDGEWHDSGPERESINPATGEVIGHYNDGGAEEAQAAIDAARRAFDHTDWSRQRELRARVLNELADRLEARQEEFIRMLTREHGKIRADATFEVTLSIPKLRYYAALALADYGRSAEVRPGAYSFTLRQPIGVAGIIVPWNAPLVLLVRSLAPALAAGCTAVIKAAGQTALTSHMFFELLSEVESLPKGVVNGFLESGNAGAPLLVSSPQVNAVSYTGSTKVGKLIMEAGAKTLKRMGLELGGKTPMIVFEDADLNQAIPVIARALTTFTGQFCMSGSRLLVQRSRLAEVRERMARALENVVVGPGDDPASQMGPLIDKANVARVDALVRAASQYARVIVRGGPVTDGPLARGAFYRPSLLEVDDPQAPLVQEEVFGPVMTLEAFDAEADAIRLANVTRYGLAAAVWTRDVDRPLRVARELDAGTVWINTHAVVHDQFEEGGFKDSGLGRLNGPGALDEFTEIKHIAYQVGVA